MRKIRKRVNTGESGRSWSVGSGRIRGTRVHGGRKYYRNQVLWVCQNCDGKGAGGFWTGLGRVTLFLILLVLLFHALT